MNATGTSVLQAFHEEGDVSGPSGARIDHPRHAVIAIQPAGHRSNPTDVPAQGACGLLMRGNRD